MYRIKSNHQIITDCTVVQYLICDGWILLDGGLWLADGVGHKMCDSQTDRQTELQMAVNAWVAFATKRFQKVIFISI